MSQLQSPPSVDTLRDALRVDQAMIDCIVEHLRTTVRASMRRKGFVLGLSGGIDSSVCAALCAKAVGPERVLGIMMPEQDSADESLVLGELLADHFGIPTLTENISPLLDGAGCYRRRDEAIRSVLPAYGAGWKSKIVLSSLFDESPYRIHSLVAENPAGEQQRVRLPLDAYQTIVAATNFKQRCRKMLEYYHADRLRYAVIGTPNRLEYDQGFFVKNGDGAADLKPIAHLYKSQVYAMAEMLGVPEIICQRPPTTDTFSLAQSQEEFFFSVPYQQMDYCLYGHNHGVDAEIVAEATGLTSDQVQRVYQDVDAKRKATAYLHQPPVLVEQVLPE